MGTHENAEDPVNSEREFIIQKLDEIEGIGRKTAEALYENGIRNYADLDQFLRQHTSKEISEALRKRGLRPGPIDREKWIRSLSNKLEHTPSPLPAEETEPGQEAKEVRSGQKKRDHDTEYTLFFDIRTDKDGKPILRTTVYDPKNAGEEKIFEGNEYLPWVNWILERANLPPELDLIVPQKVVSGETQTSQVGIDVPLAAVKPIEAKLAIDDIQISVAEPLEEIPDKRLKAVINFRLSGLDAEALASQSIPYWTEIHIIDLERGIQERFSSEERRLEPHQFDYTNQIEFPFPTVGRYRTLGFVRLRPFGDLSPFHWGPTMRITP
jgi:hypothetical protein